MEEKVDVGKVARAAKVRLDAAEAARFSWEIEGILENFQKLGEVDVEGIEPSFNPLRAKAELREDVPAPFDFDPFANARFVFKRKIVGPKVLGE
ncbi:MAG: Asp-tRNA(Asn)/Glu-tRNA(Gln) amidotransferase subunit GatC [Candidatus ainarchaeum sp.]|nr:Asp-tRNA(Asn)/Glu-tRNA(Gln) amidotransferase subunit GatC [Candidatus ainarchaeum sp.]